MASRRKTRNFQYAVLLKTMCITHVRCDLGVRQFATHIHTLRHDHQDTDHALVTHGDLIESFIAGCPERDPQMTVTDRLECRDICCKMGNCIDLVYKSCRRHPYSKAGVRIEQNTLPQTVRDYVSSGTSVMSAVLAALFNMKNMPGQWDPVLW